MKYVCTECGSDHIAIRAWVNPNKNNAYINDCDDDECWCYNCEEETTFEAKEDE